MESAKVTRSIELIEQAVLEAKRPAAMLSFGKDSMVLAHLIRLSSVKPKFPKAHGFPVDVIYHRDPWFAHKHAFADEIIRSWGMEVHDFPPFASGVKVKDDMIELVARYNFGSGAMDIPKNTCDPGLYPRRDYLCGLNDWLLRPKTFLHEYLWDSVFLGHRSADVDPFDGPIPLKSNTSQVGGVRMIFPLHDWTDRELWSYIEEHKIPVQESRYQGDLNQMWFANDYTHACTACIDPREKRETVFCPKLKVDVKNRGAEVLQLQERPDYINYEMEKV